MAHTKMALNEKTALQTATTTPADVEVRTGLEFRAVFHRRTHSRPLTPWNGSGAPP